MLKLLLVRLVLMGAGETTSFCCAPAIGQLIIKAQKRPGSMANVDDAVDTYFTFWRDSWDKTTAGKVDRRRQAKVSK